MNTDPYALLTRDGKTVDALTDAALQAAERRLGYSLSVVQGSYNPGKVAASSGTHDLGGVVDLMPWDADAKIKALRAVGFAAWFRPAIPGLWSAHLHCVLIDHARLAPSAARQVSSYLRGRNGLADDGPDLDPGWTGTARFSWRDHVDTLRRQAITERITVKRTRRDVLLDQIKRLRVKRASLK